jgi:hypothetical protein
LCGADRALGGTAWAVKKIGTKQLKNNAVTSKKIKNGAVNKGDLNAAAKVRWVRVKGSNGSVIDQSGGISAVRVIPGVYYVDFGSSTAGHGLLATNVDPNDGNDEVVVHVRRCGQGAEDLNFCAAPGQDDPSFVHVETNDLSPPGLQDANFTLALLP